MSGADTPQGGPPHGRRGEHRDEQPEEQRHGRPDGQAEEQADSRPDDRRHCLPGDRQPPGVDELLERVRSRYARVDAREAYEAARAGEALLVDIRYAALRERDGLIPGALVVERNELEWRLDPRGSHRLPEATSHDVRAIVICNEGYASSLAAASLHQLGLRRATDLIGGFQAWKAAGLPVTS